jgi:glutathione peroxidase-family protein
MFMLSCQQKDKFSIEGVVSEAENKVLYLEHNALLETIILDSMILDSDGEFKFKALTAEYPDFYSLRLDDKQIIFSVDSTENMNVRASYNNFATNYQIEGSQSSSDIQQLRKSLNDIQRKANSIRPDMGALQRSKLLLEIEAEVELHKKAAQQVILKNPQSPAAYYAIYQKLGNSYLFNPYVKEDRVFCAAVATAYHVFMPDYARSKNIYGLVIDAINAERKAKNQKALKEFINESGTGYFDIELNDRNGKSVKLSSLEGKVILIDFSAYEMKNSVDYTFELRDLYNKYHSQGLEIYQISLDRSKLVWEESVANIPWVCVRDTDGTNSRIASTYAVKTLPTMFLINREGDIVGRDYNFKTVETQILKLL